MKTRALAAVAVPEGRASNRGFCNYSGGRNLPSKSRFSRNITRARSLMFCDYVLDVEWKQIFIILMQLAVFTAAACPLPDKGPERSVNHLPAESARSWRAFDLRIATTVLYHT
jgi:hypothetical protein